MDVIKTSLIIAIGVTLYYLLLQWPVTEEINNTAYAENNSINTISDSDRLLSQPLEPLSTLSEPSEETPVEDKNYYEIKNDNLSLYIDSKTGRFEVVRQESGPLVQELARSCPGAAQERPKRCPGVFQELPKSCPGAAQELPRSCL